MKRVFLSVFFSCFLALDAHAFFFFLGGGSSGNDGSASKPYELIIDGDKRNDDKTSNYYSFYSSVPQSVTVNISDHSGWDPSIGLRLYPLNDDGSCNTSTEIASKSRTDRDFTWDISTEGGKFYCLYAYDSSWGSAWYDIRLTSTTPLKAAVSDSSEYENNSPLTFSVALSKAAPNDVTISYSFTDGTAISGVNYTNTSGTVTIPKGQQSATIDVTLKNTGMSVTKDFTITIASNDITIQNEDATATGTILASQSQTSDNNDDYEGPAICYDTKQQSGLCFFGSCMFYKEITQVRSMVNNVEKIEVKQGLTRGFAFMDVFDDYGIDDVSHSSGAQAKKQSFTSADFYEHHFANIFPSGILYALGNNANINNTPPGGSMNKDQMTSYYNSAIFKFGLFTQYTDIVKYTKDGQTHEEVLQACNPDSHGSFSATKPKLSQCGVFPGLLNSHEGIVFQTGSGITQTIESEENLLFAKTVTDTNNTALCNGSPCQADGIGSSTLLLPAFLSSQETDSVDIPYGVVIAKQQVGILNVTHDSNSEPSNLGRTIFFQAPYSPSYKGRVMLIKGISDHDSYNSSYTYVFKTGDYWIENWDISKTKPITIQTEGRVRIFIKNSFNITLNGALSIRSTSSTTPFYIFVDDAMQTDITGALAIQNGYIYTQGALGLATTNTITLQSGALSSASTLTIHNEAPSSFQSYRQDNDPSADLFATCGGGSAYITGPFDAWDITRDIASTPPTDKNISTKIVNKLFQLSLASLNEQRDAYETKEGVGTIKVALYPKTSSSTINLQKISNEISFDATSHAHVAVSSDFNISKAYKDVVVGFQLCATYEKNTTTDEMFYTLSPYSSCQSDTNIYKCDYETTTPKWHACYSSDNFAVRPDMFVISSTETDFPDQLRSGHEYNITIKANDALGSTSKEYNQAIAQLNLNNTQHWLSNFKHNGDGATLPDPATPTLGGSSFTDGNTTALLAYKEIGLITLHIQDTNWALVDQDDTPQECSGVGAWICADHNITFIPHHFSIKSLKVVNNNDVGNFTYLNNCSNYDNASFKNMSARVEVQIGAENENNQTTKNFSAGNGLYEHSVTVTFKLSNDGKDANTTTITQALLGFDNGIKTIHANESNLSKALRFNFQRQLTNPFGVDANAISSLHVNALYNTVTIEGNISTSTIKNTDKAIFYYGRASASKQRYEDPLTGAVQHNANIYYEIYCFGSTCDKALLPSGARPVYDIRWYKNPTHQPSADGNISAVAQKNGLNHVLASDLVTTTNPSTVKLKYTQSSLYGYPYSTTMEIIPSSWLLDTQDRPNATTNQFQVEFNQATSGWAGKHETNATTKTNAAVIDNRRTMW